MKNKKHPLSNKEIVDYFSRKETRSYLKKIYNNVIPSERHNIVCSMFETKKLDFGIYSKIFRLASAQFLEDDHKIDTQLWNILSKMFDTLDANKIPGLAFNEADKYAMMQVLDMRHKYIFNVFVPEGIVKCLQEKYNWTWEKANDFFVDADSRITEEELEEFDEEIKDEIKKETERKRRAIYDSHDEESDEQGKEKLSSKNPKCQKESKNEFISGDMEDEHRRVKQLGSSDAISNNLSKHGIENSQSQDHKKENPASTKISDTMTHCTVASPDSTQASQENPPVVRHKIHHKSPIKMKERKGKYHSEASNVSYCIESSVTTKSNNIIIKMIRVKDECKNEVKKEKIDSVTTDTNKNALKKELRKSVLYCFCRREYDGSFMINCHTCQEWYHPRCLNVSSKELIDKTNDMKWLCPPCKSKKSIIRKNTNAHNRPQRSEKSKSRAIAYTYQSSNNKSHIHNGYHKRTDKNRSYKVNQSTMKMIGAKNRSKSEKSRNPLPKGRQTEPLFCLCQRENDGTFMVGCDFCDEWYHPYCLNISNEKAMELGSTTWSCPKCCIKRHKLK